jgi:pimeloyl-ACP methyl ester carboxylesterase
MSPSRSFDASKLLMQLAASSAPLLEPLATYGPSARVIDAVTSWESQWRRAAEHQQSTVWGYYGLATRTEVRRLQEQFAAQQAGAAAASVNRKRVPINWDERGTGPTVLLLNGWTASGLAWPVAWVQQLEQRYQVVRPDNRGSGWSRTAPAPFTIGDMADDAAAVLRTIGVRSAIVVGLSMGGMIAQELTVRHPELVERLVVVGSQPPAPKRIVSPPRVLRRMMEPPDEQPLRQFIADTWSSVCAPGFGAAHPELVDELADQVLRRPTPRALLLQQMRAISGWSGSQRLRNITIPTVVVHGAEDPLMPVGNGMRIARLIPGAQYVELPGVGHLIPHEAPEQLTAVIDRAAKKPPNARVG